MCDKMFRLSEISCAVVLTFLLMFNAEFVRAFKIDAKIHSVRKESANARNNAFDYEPAEPVPDSNDFNNTIIVDTNFLPSSNGMLIDPRNYLVSLPPYPILYPSHANNIQSPQNHYPDPYPGSNPYSSYPYYPPVHPFPTETVGSYTADGIRYDVSAMPNMPPHLPMYGYTHQQYEALTPVPYQPPTVPDESTQTSTTVSGVVIPSEPDSSNSVYLPPDIQNYVVRKIIKIVSELTNANRTQANEHLSRDDIYSPSTNGSTVIATTTIEENNSTHVERDETKTEIHSGGNRTETAEIVQVPAGLESADTATESAQRYVVEQFLDQNGNPCTKEVVLTPQKKTYYVYTCEEKGVPHTTTSRSDVSHYLNELKTERRDTTMNTRTDKPTVTSPMNAEQTLPETLNDYAMFNMQ